MPHGSRACSPSRPPGSGLFSIVADPTRLAWRSPFSQQRRFHLSRSFSMRAGVVARPVAIGACGRLCRTLAGRGRKQRSGPILGGTTNLSCDVVRPQVDFGRRSSYGLLPESASSAGSDPSIRRPSGSAGLPPLTNGSRGDRIKDLSQRRRGRREEDSVLSVSL
jgi:hypothetical protein